MRRLSDEQIKRIAQEVLIKQGVGHAILAVKEDQSAPKRMRIVFEDDFPDVIFDLEPDYDENSIQASIECAIGRRQSTSNDFKL